MVKMLLKQGAHGDARDYSQDRPLDLALKFHNMDIVDVLREHVATIDRRASAGSWGSSGSRGSHGSAGSAGSRGEEDYGSDEDEEIFSDGAHDTEG